LRDHRGLRRGRRTDSLYCVWLARGGRTAPPKHSRPRIVIGQAGTVFYYAMGLAIVVRAVQGGILFRLWLFYSYLIYCLTAGVVIIGVRYLAPGSYASVFWFVFLTPVIAEFAVLVQVADYILDPYPAIHQVGRFLTVAVCVMFIALYVGPSLLEPRPRSLAILNLVLRSSVAKAAIVIVLLGVARYFRIPLGKNIAGIMMGFSIYLALNTANFALAETYGRSQYGQAFTTVLLLTQTLTLLVWTIALWHPQPDLLGNREVPRDHEGVPEPLSRQLGRFNTALTRLLRK
jgi:hypothetical protein